MSFGTGLATCMNLKRKFLIFLGKGVSDRVFGWRGRVKMAGVGG